MADRIVPCSSASAAATGRDSLLALSLANLLNTDGEIALWTFDWARKEGEEDLETTEVDGDAAARKAARRMKCLRR